MRITLYAASVLGVIGLCGAPAGPAVESLADAASGRLAVRSVRVVPDTQRLEVADTGSARCEPRNTHDASGVVLGNRCTWKALDTSATKVLVSGQTARIVAKRTGFHLVTAAVKKVKDSGRVAVVSDLASAPRGAELYDTAVTVMPRALTITPTSTATERTLQGHCRDPFLGPISSAWTWTVRNTGVVQAVASTKSAVTLTLVADGTTHVVGECVLAAERDSALVTVSGVTPPDPPVAACPETGYLRLVNVTTAAERNSAIANALPGDQIRLAPGTYSGGTTGSTNIIVNRSGTAANPVVMCGPRDAVFDLNAAGNFRLEANYWHLRGFRVTESNVFGLHIGANLTSGNNHHVTIDSMEIDNSQQELLAINGTSDSVTIRKNYFHHSGRGTTNAEEGVYVCESDNTTKCNGIQVIGNTFECIGTEHVDGKGGADSLLIQDNIMDGRCEQGYPNMSPNDTTPTRAVPGNAVSIISVAGKDNVIQGNTITFGSPHGIQLWQTGLGDADGARVKNNTIALFNRTAQAAPRGINASTGVTIAECTGNTVTNITSGGAAYGGNAAGACGP